MAKGVTEDRVPLVPHDREQVVGIPVELAFLGRLHRTAVFAERLRHHLLPLISVHSLQFPLHKGAQPPVEQLKRVPHSSVIAFSHVLPSSLKYPYSKIVRWTSRGLAWDNRVSSGHASTRLL